MKVTLKVIAEKAGVHISTVDKVIHNRPGVSDEVRANIQKIIKELDYRPNQAGRVLQKINKRYKIAVLLLNVDARDYILDGIRREVEKSVFDIQAEYLFSGFLDIEKQCAYLQKVREEQYDGVILFPNYGQRMEEEINLTVEAGIPVVTVNSDVKDSRRLCYVGQNGARGAHVAGRMMGLFLGGTGKIAVITSTISSENCDYHVATRRSEFTRFLAEQYPDIRIARDVESFEDRNRTYSETKKLLREVPDLDGIYITCGCVDVVGKAVQETGRASELRLVSFETYPEVLHLLDQNIIDCTIGSDLTEQGSRSMQILMDHLVNGTNPESKFIYMDSHIMVRESIL